MSSKFFERLDLKYDVARLASEIRELEQSFVSKGNTNNYQSWSLLSKDGHYGSGFENYFSYKNGPLDSYISRRNCPNPKEIYFCQDEKVPTEVCQGYFREVLVQLDQMGFWPRRARINKMKPGTATSVHVDITNESYAAVLHIPIKTHPLNVFNFVEQKFHFPADGAGYIIDQTKPHQFINNSTLDRYHLLVCVWDTQKITKQFQFPVGNLPRESGIEWNGIKKVAL